MSGKITRGSSDLWRTPSPLWERIEPARLLLGDWWKEGAHPVAWEEILPGGPMHLEVGFGGGEFLLGMARRHPECRFVGVERFAEGHRGLVKNVLRLGLTNVLSAVGDAHVVVEVCFADGSLESVTLNFSDPWPKARHASRRLFTEEFLGLAARKLRPGGRLHLATDDGAYAEQAIEELAKLPLLSSTHPGLRWMDSSPCPLRTRYEEKWIREGRPLHYLVYERR
ncbi:MAG: tRNA (guanosine(46)-N7)-methyltransferase TrmB [Acidobacteriota bacterium]